MSRTQQLEDTGLEVVDLRADKSFASRQLPGRGSKRQMEGMRRVMHAFVESPSTILQELVNAAVELCGADSAGISIELPEGGDEKFYQWVATAGQYSGFLHASLPRYPSACGVCLERGTPQRFRVTPRFFEILGVEAPPVTDGILLPWRTDEVRGTIFVMAHDRAMAFDADDCELMEMLASFAAMAVRHSHQQQQIVDQATSSAAVSMANHLAHEINNPLQSLTNQVYLALEGRHEGDARMLAEELSDDLNRLSMLVKRLLELPIESTRTER